MIPKTIHYCWFGGNPLPELAQKCIASWKKYCPDYEIIEWNESNYDISTAPLYVREAYEAKKWGFVPDYIRLELIYKYGGIYLDTDVEIIKSLDVLTELKGFCGLEDGKWVALGLGFGAEPGNELLYELMNVYKKASIYDKDGSLNLIPAPQIDTSVFINNGFIENNRKQIVKELTVFPTDYFCPVNTNTGDIVLTDNTFSIHHYAASWFSEEEKYIKKLRYKYYKKLHCIKLAHWLSLAVGFSKYRGLLKMPKSMINYKMNNLKNKREKGKGDN